MSAPSGQYILYYSVRSPFSSDEQVHEEQFDDIVDALSTAFRVEKEGGDVTGIVHDEAWLFSGDDLKDVLKRISKAGAQDVQGLAEVVRGVLPQALIKQLVKTVKFSHEHFGAVAVYRSMLEELYDAADQAIKEKDLELLYRITGKLAFWYVPSESDVKQMGKDFLHAYRRDAGWLRDTKKALESIKKAAEELEVVGPRNEELKAQIIDAAEHGLIIHI